MKRRTAAKTVVQIDLNTGRVLNVYPSLVDAAIAVGGAITNVSSCARGKCPSAYGFTWRFPDGGVPATYTGEGVAR